MNFTSKLQMIFESSETYTMGKQKIILLVLLILILIIAIASTIIYFILVPEKPWKAFYIVCCGGVLIVNLILSMIFVKKNIR